MCVSIFSVPRRIFAVAMRSMSSGCIKNKLGSLLLVEPILGSSPRSAHKLVTVKSRRLYQ